MNPNFRLTSNNDAGGITLAINNKIKVLSETYLQSDTDIASTNFLVENTDTFSTNDIVLISQLGAENAEFGVVASVTDTENMVFPAISQNHNRGEILQRALYNQLVIERSVDALTWATVATIDMDPSRTTTSYFDPTGLVDSYYRVAFRNSVLPANSNYSSVQQSIMIPGTSTVGGFISSIRSSEGVLIEDEVITDKFLVNAINDARTLTDQLSYGYSRSWRQVFDHPISLLAGSNYADAPDDLEFDNTNRKILSLRIPTRNTIYQQPLHYVDKRMWNDIVYSYIYSFVATDALIGDATLVLEKTGNLPANGTIQVACEGATDDILTVTYTGNDVLTNTLTGVTGITRNLSAGTQIWQSFAYGYPFHYTIFEGRIWFTIPLPQELNGTLASLDYYKRMDALTDLSQEFPENYSEIYKPYVKWAIRKRMDSNITTDDGDYQLFEKLVMTLQDANYTGQYQRIITS